MVGLFVEIRDSLTKQMFLSKGYHIFLFSFFLFESHSTSCYEYSSKLSKNVKFIILNLNGGEGKKALHINDCMHVYRLRGNGPTTRLSVVMCTITSPAIDM